MTEKTNDELKKWPTEETQWKVGSKVVEQKKKWQLPSSANTAYNKNKVIQTRAGHLIEQDDTEGAERIRILHANGAFVEMRPDGSIQYRQQNKYEIVAGESNMKVKGAINIEVSGEANIKVAGDCNAEVGGKLTGTVGGDWNMKISGGTTLETAGAVVIKGATIALNP